MNLRLLPLLGLPLLAACTQSSGPLKLYFIASSRFTSGNRLGVGAGDTLATRLFATDSMAGGNGLQKVRVTVTYSPTRQPFAYPNPITAFVYSGLPTGEQVTYLDSTLGPPYPHSFLLTSVFGVRTTAGAERWEYTATDAAGNTATRSFVATVRRTDSTRIYHEYTLKLNVPARGVSTRRFIQLKPGLALPAAAVLGTPINPDLQALTDLIQSADGLRLYAPDVASPLDASRWPTNRRRATRFYLTALDASGYDNQADTLSIRQQFRAPGVGTLSNLAVNQVYAFRTYPLAGSSEHSSYGLLRVASVPGGTTAGLQLQIRIAKQPL